jgi:hypothetical protein
MQSRSNPQLMGKRIDSVQVKTCDPIMLNSDVATPLYSYLMPKDATDEEKKEFLLNPDDMAYPCGLIAKSVFTDTFVLQKMVDSDYVTIEFDESNIAWKSDVAKFQN